MIVIGTDTYKKTHTCGAVFAGTGQRAGELTAPAREAGFAELLAWGRELDPERIWALKDCRHVSGSLERFLIASGEHIVRIPPKRGESRRGQRTRGKSDPIDALAIARAALREGPETLPAAHLDEAALEIKLLLDHRKDLVKARSEDRQRLRWHLHNLWPEFELPAGCLDRIVWLDRVKRKFARAPQSARVRVSRELVRAICERTKCASELEREIGAMVRAQAPQLPGCGTLTAAKLIAETAGAARFASDAKLDRLAGVDPIPASSGNRTRLRLDRGGNRQLNCAVHRIAVTQSRMHPPAREFLARKRAEGKSNREALRCLKRHLIRRVWRLLNDSEIDRSVETVDAQRGLPVPHLAAAA